MCGKDEEGVTGLGSVLEGALPPAASALCSQAPRLEGPALTFPRSSARRSGPPPPR